MGIREYSIRKAGRILEKKGLLDECKMVRLIWDKPNRKDWLQKQNWQTEYVFEVGKLRPRFDAYKEKVGLEHETREQMNVRSHLLMSEVAYRNNVIDVLVMIIPKGRNASFDRTRKELEDDLFAKYFPIRVPIFLIE